MPLPPKSKLDRGIVACVSTMVVVSTQEVCGTPCAPRATIAPVPPAGSGCVGILVVPGITPRSNQVMCERARQDILWWYFIGNPNPYQLQSRCGRELGFGSHIAKLYRWVKAQTSQQWFEDIDTRTCAELRWAIQGGLL